MIGLGGIGEDILDRLKNKTAIGIAAGKIAILVTHDVLRLRAGELTADQFRVRAGGHLGSSAGIVLGAATGAAFGAIVPGIGNIAGAFTGGMIGAMAGEEVGRFTASLLEPHVVTEPEPRADGDEHTSDRDPPASS